jgi:hypothetical protein
MAGAVGDVVFVREGSISAPSHLVGRLILLPGPASHGWVFVGRACRRMLVQWWLWHPPDFVCSCCCYCSLLHQGLSLCYCGLPIIHCVVVSALCQVPAHVSCMSA